MKKQFTILAVVAFVLFNLQSVFATDVSGTIAVNTAWNLAGSPYVVTSSITVNNGVTLTIQSGVTVKFADGQSMYVNGTMNATSATFTSNNVTPTPGIWGLIQTGNASYSATVTMTGSTVEYSSYFYVNNGTATLNLTDLLNSSNHGVYIESTGIFNMTDGNINTNAAWAAGNGAGIFDNSGTATLSSVNIQHYLYGMYFALNSQVSFANSTVTNCSWPIYYTASADLTLTGINNFTGNTNSAINMNFGTLPDTINLPATTLSYYFPSGMTINNGAKMIIGTGNTIKIANGQSLYVYGILNANTVTFTSSNASPTSGIWGFIQIGNASYSATTTLTDCLFEYAQYFHVLNGTATLTNTDLTNFLNYGLSVSPAGICNMSNGSINTNSSWALTNGAGAYGGGGIINLSSVNIQHFNSGVYLMSNSTMSLTGVAITNCSWPITYYASADLTLNGTNSFTGNTNSSVYLTFSSISDTLLLPIISIPYYLPSGISINNGAKMTIGTGNTVKIADGQAFYNYGILNANTVTFTSSNASPTPGIWGNFQTGNASYSGTTTLIDCIIQYAGTFHVNRGTATITNTDLTNFFYHGAQIDEFGILYMTNGSINTNSAWAAANGCGINGNSGKATISSVNIQHFQYGINLMQNANVSLTNVAITNCYWPIIYQNSADLTLGGTNSFTGNTRNAVLMSFWSVSDTLILPTFVYPYYFPNTMTINAGGRMEIAEDNILKFIDGAILYVDGTLIANATAGHNIFFTSMKDDNWGGDSNIDGTTTAPANSNWYGVWFRETSIDANCSMQRCKIRYAGYGSYGGITMTDASPTIDNCDISICYYGIYMQNASNPTLSNNTIGSSSITPIAMSFEANPTMSNNALSFSDNQYDAIGLIGGTLTANATIKKRSFTSTNNITYVMLNQVTIPVGKTLTINKGIVIKSLSYTYNFNIYGTLNAIGTADSMITFTSVKDDNHGNPGDSNKDGTMTSPTINDNGGFVYFTGATGTMDYCRIKYAQVYNFCFMNASHWECAINSAISTLDASPTISNCEFKDLYYGISCYRASNPTISNNSMTNITYTPFAISGSANPTFVGNTFTNVGLQALGLVGGYVTINGTIRKRDVAGYTNITYVLLGTMYVDNGTNLTVEQDVVIKVNAGTFVIDGGFKAQGTAGHKITITSIHDDNSGNPFDTNGNGNGSTPDWGNWAGIQFNPSSDDGFSIIDYCDLKYGGGSPAGINFTNASPTVSNTLIFKCYYYGVRCEGISAPIFNNVVFQNTYMDPIAMSLTSDPQFSNITFTATGSKGIKILEGTLSTNATLNKRSVAGIPNIGYIIGDLTISSNAIFTIAPGVVIKFRDGSGMIYVYGGLRAIGTPSEKIVMTSYADDSVGEDTNNNGNGTSPTPGAWAGISFWPSSDDANNILKNCDFRYIGGGVGEWNTYASADAGIKIKDAYMLIDSCIFSLGSGNTFGIFGSANPLIRNTQITNFPGHPVNMSMFSNPTFGNNITCMNMGYMGISLFPETYSQNDTFVFRSFAGIDSITYTLSNYITINTGTEITIPAGMIFKNINYGYFNINGKLTVNGTASHPVIFTSIADDTYGNPRDAQTNGNIQPSINGYRLFNYADVSDDSSKINFAHIRYYAGGVGCSSASPIITNNKFEKCTWGILLGGIAAPVIDNNQFIDLTYGPFGTSILSYPSSTLNNTISGTTYKVIGIWDETLTQDITLPKRNFGGITNIPYLMGNYTVGTGATLTVSPGVVIKFGSWGGITVNKGLIAEGGASADSTIVFTSIQDDTYGGDSNSDGTVTNENSDWVNFISLTNTALDPLCRFKHVIFKRMYSGLTLNSRNPTITYCAFLNNRRGVVASNASNPVINYCDFDYNSEYAIYNEHQTFVINAENNWWGSNNGPTHSGNLGGTGDVVNNSIDYIPFRTGTVNPIMGDVSLNGLVQAYDASLVLQSVVGSLVLNSTQLNVSDVSGTAGITAYDASLILQYVVGIIQTFPAETLRVMNPALLVSDVQLTVGSATAANGEDVNIPLNIANVSGMTAAQIKLHYDPAFLQPATITSGLNGMSLFTNIDEANGIITIAMAGTDAINTDATLANIIFHTTSLQGTATASVSVELFMANETDLTTISVPGMVTITNNATGMFTGESIATSLLPVVPNPTNGNATIVFTLANESQMVNIEVFSLVGQKVLTLVNQQLPKGTHTITLTDYLDKGAYIIRMTADGFVQNQMIQVTR